MFNQNNGNQPMQPLNFFANNPQLQQQFQAFAQYMLYPIRMADATAGIMRTISAETCKEVPTWQNGRLIMCRP